jgi:hypothetical protein
VARRYPILVTTAVAACLAAAATACSPADPVVDTWPVGRQLPCDEAHRCSELTIAGLGGLDSRDPGHPPVVSTSLHEEGRLRDAEGKPVSVGRSGGPFGVLVVILRDGSTHAIGVGYTGAGQTVVAFPWESTAPSWGQ